MAAQVKSIVQRYLNVAKLLKDWWS